MDFRQGGGSPAVARQALATQSAESPAAAGDVPTPRGLVAFRTHLWDADIAAMARRLFERRGGWDFAVLADETQATLDTSPYPKIGHTEDFSDLGLPRSGDRRELWYNSDYSFYRLLQVEPKYDHFCVSEYDVFVNVDLTAMLAAAIDEKLDIVTHAWGPAPADWMFYASAAPVYPVVSHSFNPFVILSRRALEHLLGRRQALARDLRSGRFATWPHFEAFVGSELTGNDAYRKSPLSRFGGIKHFSFAPPYRPDAAGRLLDQILVHPVLHGGRYVRARLRGEKRPEDFLDPASALRRDLDGLPLPIVVTEVAGAIGRKRHRRTFRERGRRALVRLRRAAHRLRLPGMRSQCDIAAGCFTLQSSTAPGIPSPGSANAGFVTAVEDDPWWAVDLGREFAIERVVLHLPVGMGRPDLPLILKTARQDGALVACARRSLAAMQAAGRPATIVLDYPAVARIVQLQLGGRGRLAIDRCAIFAREVRRVGA